MNIVANNPTLFTTLEGRHRFCQDHHFLPCDDIYSQPRMDKTVREDTQFFIAATFKDNLYAEARASRTQLMRKGCNLIPTAFVYESDSLPIKEQLSNIKAEAFGRHVLSVTYSGGKSMHVVVPIAIDEGKTIADNKEYKFLWGMVAKMVFKDISPLDSQCATIGRLSRLPGAKRKDKDTIQQCVFYNPDCEIIGLKEFQEEWNESQKRAQMATRRRPCRPTPTTTPRTGKGVCGSQLKALVRSNTASPSPCKEIAVMVLKEGHIPSSDLLPKNGSYVGTLTFLYSHYMELLEPFFEKVKDAHPSCLPEPFEWYLDYLEKNADAFERRKRKRKRRPAATRH